MISGSFKIYQQRLRTKDSSFNLSYPWLHLLDQRKGIINLIDTINIILQREQMSRDRCEIYADAR